MMRSRTARTFAAAMLVAVFIVGAAVDSFAHRVRLVAGLSGEAEVPGPGDEDGSGRAVVRVNDEKRRLCFRIVFRDIAEPNGGHIHRARKGESGDVVLPLFEGTTGSPVEGCVQVGRRLARSIQRDPRGYYVNIHNEEFPAGALRGQLRLAG